MFTETYDVSSNELQKARLNQAAQTLRGLSFPTREEYQAEVYSLVNRVLNLGGSMTPLARIEPEGAAKIGDIEDSLTILNNDAQAVIAELLDAENQAASVYNLFASTQNSLRQAIRQMIYASTPASFLCAFLGPDYIDTSSTATIDYNAADAACTLVNETQLTATAITVGASSVGAIDSSSALANLTDGQEQTLLQWNGVAPAANAAPVARLELIFNFSPPVILNRITLSLDQYNGLQLAELTSSPDGSLREDLTADLLTDELLLSGASSKYSGDVILDLAPHTVTNLRVVVVDPTGQGSIALRQISFFQRQYSAAGLLNSTPLALTSGSYWFSTVEKGDPQFGSIAHQISPDGVHFTSIQPEAVVTVSGMTWYRAALTRNDKAFTTSSPFLKPPSLNSADPRLAGQDPATTSNYTLVSNSTKDLGNNLLLRTINLSNVSGTVQLEETPLAATLQVFYGLSPAPATSWGFANDTLVFNAAQPQVKIVYQISALASASLALRAPYYSPFLLEYQFTSL